MNKISIGETVGQAYKFAFGRYFAILGVIWLPLVLLAAIALFTIVPFLSVLMNTIPQAIQHRAAGGGPNPLLDPGSLQALERMRAFSLLFNVAELAAIAIISVGIVKEAMGLRNGFRPVYVAWGLDELLVAGGYFLVYIMLIVFVVAAAIAGAIIFGIGALAIHAASGSWIGGAAGAGVLIALAVAVACCALVFLTVRFMFFIVPVTVAEREFGVFRSWELSKGNFWRILATLFLTWVPMFVFLNAIWGAAFWYVAFPAIIGAIHSHNAEGVGAAMKTILANLKADWPWLLALYLVPLPFVYGLLWSPAAFAYRELKPAEAAAE